MDRNSGVICDLSGMLTGLALLSLLTILQLAYEGDLKMDVKENIFHGNKYLFGGVYLGI